MTIGPTGTNSVNRDTAKVAEAFANQVNNAGGLGGRKLEVITCNDKFDPNVAASCARQAVQQKVSAVLGGLAIYTTQMLPLFEKAGIPFIGDVNQTAAEFTSNVTYPLFAGPLAVSDLGNIAAQKCSSTAVMLVDTPASGAVVPAIASGLKAAGKKVNKTILVPPTTVDFSSPAKAMAGYDCTILVIPPNQVAPLLTSAQQLGVKTTYIVAPGAMNATVAKKFASQLEGSVVASTFPGPSEAVWAKARKAVGTAADMSDEYDLNTWASFVVFQQLVATIHGDVTSTAVRAAIATATSLNTGGLTPTLNLTKGLRAKGLQRVFNPTAVHLTIHDGKLLQQNGTRGPFIDLGAGLR